MSTATMTADALNSTGPHPAFAAAGATKAAGTSKVAWQRFTDLIGSGRSRLAAFADRIGLTRVYNWLRALFNSPRVWVIRDATRYLSAPLVGYALTTRWGTNFALNTAPRFVLRTVLRVGKIMCWLPAWALSKFEGGRQINRKVKGWANAGTGIVLSGLDSAHNWLADRHGSIVVRLIRSVFALVIFTRVMTLLSPAGWLFYALFAAFVFFAPLAKVETATYGLFEDESEDTPRHRIVIDQWDTIAATVYDTVLAIPGVSMAFPRDEAADAVNASEPGVGSVSTIVPPGPTVGAGALGHANQARRDTERVNQRAQRPAGQNRQRSAKRK